MSGPPRSTALVRRAVRAALADLPGGSLVLVAVSGGGDSLALAAATAFEAPRAGLTAGAVVVDHGLQAGSAGVAGSAASACASLGLEPVLVLRAVVERGAGPEADARAARFAALQDAADRIGARAVLLAHTLDDQAETVLLGLARGSGARSLAGMTAARGLWLRPLLGLPRAVVREAAEQAGLTPWEDPQNSDPALARSRVRHDALPALERALGPGVAAALARTALLLQQDAEALDALAAEALQRHRLAGPQAEVALDVEALALEPTAVRRRVLLAAAQLAGSSPAALAMSHATALDALVVDWHGQGAVHLPGAVVGWRLCGRLALARRPDAGSPPSPQE